MRGRSAFLVAAAVFACTFAPLVARADYWDDFRDGYWTRSPNDPRYDANDPNWTDPNNPVLWDCDNPDWSVYEIIGSSQVIQVVSDTVAKKALRMATDADPFLYMYGQMGAGVVTDVPNPNTSPTYFDETSDHYALAWVYYTGYEPNGPNQPPYSFLDPRYDPNKDDPNRDKGYVMILMNADTEYWTGMGFQVTFAPVSWGPRYRDFAMKGINFFGDGVRDFRKIWIDPNDPNWAAYPSLPDGFPFRSPPNPSFNPYRGPNYGGAIMPYWYRSGFWMLLQFELDPNRPQYPGDPNGKYLKAAVWHGDKYDWDGKWLMEGELSSPWRRNVGGLEDPNGIIYPNGEWYFGAGQVFFMVASDKPNFGGFPADAAFDNIEVRNGRFSNTPRRLHLTVGHTNWGAIGANPDLRDPTDPNTPDEKIYRYTDGTNVVLVAQPISGKSFKEWLVYDPNYPGDLNHATTDSNSVLRLTMNADWVVEADFKCGSGLEPFVAMVLIALAAGVVVRRLT
jgi:hypothetical protein